MADDLHGGASALCIRAPKLDHQNRSAKIVSDPFPVEGGKLYALFGWMKLVDWDPDCDVVQICLSWLDSKGGKIASDDSNYLAIRETSPWRAVQLNVPAPPGAVRARIHIGVHAGRSTTGQPPRLLADDFHLQKFEVPASPARGARSWTYLVTAFGVHAPMEPDVHARLGRAQHAVVGRDLPGGLISGPLIPDQDSGLYRVAFRMKVEDNTRPVPVVVISVVASGLLNSHSFGSRTIRATDFDQPNRYQDFTFDFFRPPAGGMQYPCHWSGKVNLWLDTFTVTELHRFSDRELLSTYAQEPNQAVLKPNPEGALYVLRGLSFSLWRLDEVASALGTKVARVSFMSTPGGNGVLTPPFPSAAAELSGLRAVVMADVDAASLGFRGRNALRQFVEAGGTLVILGGWMAYAEAKVRGTFIEDMLPVRIAQAFDRTECAPPSVLASAGAAGFALKAAWQEKPACLWIHNLVPQTGARVLVLAGRKPFMVVGQHGKGRVIVCAGTVLGRPRRWIHPFWTWKSWPQLLAQAMAL